MITCFPTLYPDELLYSLFARYSAQSGHIAYMLAAEDLFASRTTKPDTLLAVAGLVFAAYVAGAQNRRQ